ncbi:hypothetical protein [Stenotrophomonas rhizophila]|uniref:hypothetical protein n=1 Tax=Stenotrophomonas rhizophila TaxID=216778 RepID=UPI001E57CE32|nr:hypothetical protein [Stenotrophomonas rhizophila]MCC7634344.1 hypothetical protein [Stenotrophomonas rhizophila]MCC7664038.1 hypothetical protein [Stenotrophomonas rhizophila]
MSNLETCPRCSTRFDSRKALFRSGVPMFFNAITARNVQMVVRCPKCGYRFDGQDVRLFGFLPPEGLRWVLVGLLALCVILMFALPPR